MADSETIENRRKRLRFRSWHRGTKEMDLLMGSFADAHLGDFGDEQLDRYEALLDVPEPVVYDWILGRTTPPADYDHDVTKLLLPYEPTDVLAELAAHKAAHPDFNISNVHFFPLGGIKTNANWAIENGGENTAPVNLTKG